MVRKVIGSLTIVQAFWSLSVTKLDTIDNTTEDLEGPKRTNNTRNVVFQICQYKTKNRKEKGKHYF